MIGPVDDTPKMSPWKLEYAPARPARVVFHKASHLNPLVRALALRTMGCIRVDRIASICATRCASACATPSAWPSFTTRYVVAALSEIYEASGEDHFRIDHATLSKLLTALGECSEWGRVFILYALSKFEATAAAEALDIAERDAPQLNHGNAAVVMAATKVMFKVVVVIVLVETRFSENKLLSLGNGQRTLIIQITFTCDDTRIHTSSPDKVCH